MALEILIKFRDELHIEAKNQSYELSLTEKRVFFKNPLYSWVKSLQKVFQEHSKDFQEIQMLAVF